MNATNNEVRIHLKTPNGEMDVQGDPMVIQQFLAPFFGAEIAPTKTNGTPSLVGSDNVPEQVTNTSSPAATQATDLLTFYRKMAPKSQQDQVLVIAYYYQKYQYLDQLTLDTYDEAYSILQRLPVPRPSNMKSSVRNLVDRTEYLHNPERGAFMLTVKGEEYVESMPHDD
jgi:hypothetical protein